MVFYSILSLLTIRETTCSPLSLCISYPPGTECRGLPNCFITMQDGETEQTCFDLMDLTRRDAKYLTVPYLFHARERHRLFAPPSRA